MRKFLVILDDSRECLNAMRFAAMRAEHTGAGVTILSVIPPELEEEALRQAHERSESPAECLPPKECVGDLDSYAEVEEFDEDGNGFTEIYIAKDLTT